MRYHHGESAPCTYEVCDLPHTITNLVYYAVEQVFLFPCEYLRSDSDILTREIVMAYTYMPNNVPNLLRHHISRLFGNWIL